METAITTLPRSPVLFFPAIVPRFYESLEKRARTAGGLVVDLEDSVARHAKAAARDAAVARSSELRRIRETTGVRILLRVNGGETAEFAKDLNTARILAQEGAIEGVVYPKASDRLKFVPLEKLAEKFGLFVFATIETLAGYRGHRDFLRDNPLIHWVVVGSEDLTAELGIERGVTLQSSPLAARIAEDVALTVIENRILLIGCVWPFEIFEPTHREALRRETAWEISIGARGKCVFHPRHMSVVEECFETVATDVEAITRRVLSLDANAANDVAVAISGGRIAGPFDRLRLRNACRGRVLGRD